MIVVFGSINVDLVFSVGSLPRPGETAIGPSYRVVPGGKGANQAVAAARAGARVALFGRVGRDGFAGVARDGLAAAGVDCAGVLEDEAPTGCAAICVDPQGRNQIAVASGANANVSADQVGDSWLGPETTVLMQMEVPAEENLRLARRARARGARSLINVAPELPLPRDALSAFDWLVVNESEASALARRVGLSVEAPAALAASLARTLAGPAVVVTLGADGAVACSGGKTWRVAALAVTPVDTTAAGDAFVGVFAAALDAGDTMATALHRASVAGGLACLVAGAQPSLPDGAAIAARLGELAPPHRLD